MASAEVISGTPLAQALQNAVQPKLAENGWSSGAGDDSALSEYIILMLASGKTQDQISSELADDLLGLGPEDPSPKLFAQWLFDQVTVLNAQINGGAPSQEPNQGERIQVENTASAASNEDAIMSAAIDTAGAGAIPTGPKSMRNGSGGGPRGRDRRMLGQLRGAMDRGNDAGIHKIKGAASRINTHNRDPTTGPRNTGSRMRGAMMGGQPMNQQAMANMAQSVSSEQQMALYQMLEEQSRMMAQLLGANPGASAPAINPKFFNNNANPRSLFDRVDRRQPRGNAPPRPHQAGDDATGSDADMDGEKKPQAQVPCKFQLQCTSAACPFAHQSPAAAPGTSVDVTDTCSYGAACTNKKCVGAHPSPAQKRQYLGSSVDCKFYPNCTNPSCPFRHPAAPPCRNGADCPDKDSGCRFSHSTILCRYHPCLNPKCVFKHVDGQRQTAAGGEHVSERKFTNGEGEELVLPGRGTDVEVGDGVVGREEHMSEVA